MIHIHGLTYTYPACETPALYGIDLTCRRGSFAR